jgi:transposase
MKISVLAVDLAKSKFQVHGFDGRGEKQLAKTLKRADFLRFFQLREERCEVVMEACSASHHWGRQLLELGYRVRLLPAQHVKPYVVGNKNDANDADAIHEASQRPRIRAVAVKSVAQQDGMLVHATRERLIKARTALINQMRGELAERGVIFERRPGALRRGLIQFLEHPAAGDVTSLFQHWLRDALDEWERLDLSIRSCELQIRRAYQQSVACSQLGAVEGIGPITATAAVAQVGDGRQFQSSRQFAAWVGLTPKEKSSGQARHLGSITKRGDGYLRKLLVHGARAALRAAATKTDARSQWINALVARRGHNRACVALANKNARIIWAMLTSGQAYRGSVTAQAA